jgi:hypothetical protein
VQSVSSTSTTTTASTSFTDVSNAVLTVTVPAGETDVLVAHFSSDSACYGGSALRACQVKVIVDSTDLNPVSSGSTAFDNNDLGLKTTSTGPIVNTFNAKSSNDFESHAIVRYSGNLAAGAHVVKVQFSTSNGSTSLDLRNWSLVVERVKVS